MDSLESKGVAEMAEIKMEGPKKIEVVYAEVDKDLVKMAKSAVQKPYKKTKTNMVVMGLTLLIRMPWSEVVKYLSPEAKEAK